MASDSDPAPSGPTTGYREIEYGVVDNIAEITLSVPAKRNRLSTVMRGEIVAALRHAGDDDSVRVVLISGAGPSFCSGYDLAPSGEEDERRLDGAADAGDGGPSRKAGQFSRDCLRDWLTIWDLAKPVVAMVHGHCLAGGTELMSMCDIVFAADNARIGYPALRTLPAPHVPYLPWKITMAQAKYLQLTGTSVTGEEAAAMGWVAKSFAPEDLRSETFRHLRPLSQIPARVLASNKQNINEAYELMGMRTYLRGSWQWHALGEASQQDEDEFGLLLRTRGVRAAVEWRDRAFEAEGVQ